MDQIFKQNYILGDKNFLNVCLALTGTILLWRFVWEACDYIVYHVTGDKEETLSTLAICLIVSILLLKIAHHPLSELI